MSECTDRTVLVVEGDVVVAELLRILLEDDGCRIVCAQSAREGIELARATHPELLTLDLQLPDAEGESVLQALAADPALRQTPVIMVSGRRPRFASGAAVVGHLPEPFDASELDRLVHQALRERESPRTLRAA
jgi:CheY-like chemotaxis protein